MLLLRLAGASLVWWGLSQMGRVSGELEAPIALLGSKRVPVGAAAVGACAWLLGLCPLSFPRSLVCPAVCAA